MTLLGTKGKISPKGLFMNESLRIVTELTLSMKDAAEIKGPLTNCEFEIDGKIFQCIIQRIPSPVIYGEVTLEGDIANVAFMEKGRDISDPYTFTRQKGNINAIKLYNTIYKILSLFASLDKPDYIIIASTYQSGYHPIYLNLVTNNKIPGYMKKTIISFKNNKFGDMMGVVLKRKDMKDIKETIKEIIKEEMDSLPFYNPDKKFEFSSNEMYMIYRDLHNIEDYILHIKDTSSEAHDRKARLKRIIKLVDKKFK